MEYIIEVLIICGILRAMFWHVDEVMFNVDEVIEETQPSSKRPPSKQKAKDQEEHHPKRLKEVTDNINEEIDENGFSEDVRHIIERVEKRAKENIVTSQTEFEELMANHTPNK